MITTPPQPGDLYIFDAMMVFGDGTRGGSLLVDVRVAEVSDEHVWVYIAHRPTKIKLNLDVFMRVVNVQTGSPPPQSSQNKSNQLYLENQRRIS